MSARFHDRADAGRELVAHLQRYANRPDVIVLALPRGGVPVGDEVARGLGVPLDVFVVRKLGLPWHEEVAMGALASGGARMIDERLIQAYGLDRSLVDEVVRRESLELDRRERLYRGQRPFPDLVGKTVILVDDGLATGSSMRVAVEALRAKRPAGIVVAVPIAPPDTCDAMREVADEVVCAVTPDPFYAVGLWYENFAETSDDDVRILLQRARRPPASAARNRARAH
jgi:putative phosphoribosyl transferase